jgi:hypothetical protein
MSSVKVTQLPYIGPRKARKQESSVSCVKWKHGYTMYFQWFKRDSAAVKFCNTLIEQGYIATVTQQRIGA